MPIIANVYKSARQVLKANLAILNLPPESTSVGGFQIKIHLFSVNAPAAFILGE